MKAYFLKCFGGAWKSNQNYLVEDPKQQEPLDVRIIKIPKKWDVHFRNERRIRNNFVATTSLIIDLSKQRAGNLIKDFLTNKHK